MDSAAASTDSARRNFRGLLRATKGLLAWCVVRITSAWLVKQQKHIGQICVFLLLHITPGRAYNSQKSFRYA